jgi:hypothetical protein
VTVHRLLMGLKKAYILHSGKKCYIAFLLNSLIPMILVSLVKMCLKYSKVFAGKCLFDAFPVLNGLKLEI